MDLDNWPTDGPKFISPVLATMLPIQWMQMPVVSLQSTNAAINIPRRINVRFVLNKRNHRWTIYHYARVGLSTFCSFCFLEFFTRIGFDEEALQTKHHFGLHNSMLLFPSFRLKNAFCCKSASYRRHMDLDQRCWSVSSYARMTKGKTKPESTMLTRFCPASFRPINGITEMRSSNANRSQLQPTIAIMFFPFSKLLHAIRHWQTRQGHFEKWKWNELKLREGMLRMTFVLVWFDHWRSWHRHPARYRRQELPWNSKLVDRNQIIAKSLTHEKSL